MPTIEDVAVDLSNGKYRKVVFMVGAGISTSAGIPDFRTPGTGIYSNLQKLNLPYPEAVFDISYLRKRPEAFYTLARELYPGQFEPTLFHRFMTLVDKKGYLQRLYTQNIDTLERIAGVSPHKVVEAHGSFASNHCIDCGHEMSIEDMKRIILGDQYLSDDNEGGASNEEGSSNGEGSSNEKGSKNDASNNDRSNEEGSTNNGTWPKNVNTKNANTKNANTKNANTKNANTKNSNKKNASTKNATTKIESQMKIPTCANKRCPVKGGGIVKPDIVFFGEGLPELFFDSIEHDLPRNADLVIVAGTSLTVSPFSQLPEMVSSHCVRLLFNKDRVGDFGTRKNDIMALGDCDKEIEKFIKLCGWWDDLTATDGITATTEQTKAQQNHIISPQQRYEKVIDDLAHLKVSEPNDKHLSGDRQLPLREKQEQEQH